MPELGRQAIELAALLADELQKATLLALEELPVGHSFDI